jgi:hypothetical protein
VPKALERKLKAECKKKGLSKKRCNAYVYGTMRKTGWVPSTQAVHGAIKKGK